ncbi:MAG: hypothetical protein K9H64_08665 [Bacteroidales bacterium]|nr:hypothetical protein [Bacteroidales bacterium]MCF8455904.1 hypothetical protein [Bacteroidales bacterium]
MKKIVDIIKIVSFVVVALSSVPMLIHLLTNNPEECKISPVHIGFGILFVLAAVVSFFLERKLKKNQ